MDKLPLTVIICTHNPRLDYLDQTLRGLRSQSLPLLEWELILIDNCSDEPLAEQIDLSWHPHGRLLREGELGLTPARLRALSEAQAEVVVFVDDDNFLERDYLKRCVEIGEQWPMLGAWGAGVLKGVFETEPPDWLEPYFWYFTVHRVDEDRWSNRPDLDCFPPGAGLAVRKEAVRPYVDVTQNDSFRRSLDRRGDSLSSSGDMDMLWIITESGWGVGRFTRLKLRHLIPSTRLEEDYIERLIANQWCSNVLLHYLHGRWEMPQPERTLRRLSRWRYERSLGLRERWAYRAERRGRQHAAEMIAELERGNREVQQTL